MHAAALNLTTKVTTLVTISYTHMGNGPRASGSTSIHHGIPATDRAWCLAYPAVVINHGP